MPPAWNWTSEYGTWLIPTIQLPAADSAQATSDDGNITVSFSAPPGDPPLWQVTDAANALVYQLDGNPYDAAQPLGNYTAAEHTGSLSPP